VPIVPIEPLCLVSKKKKKKKKTMSDIL